MKRKKTLNLVCPHQFLISSLLVPELSLDFILLDHINNTSLSSFEYEVFG